MMYPLLLYVGRGSFVVRISVYVCFKGDATGDAGLSGSVLSLYFGGDGNEMHYVSDVQCHA